MASNPHSLTDKMIENALSYRTSHHFKAIAKEKQRIKEKTLQLTGVKPSDCIVEKDFGHQRVTIDLLLSQDVLCCK